MNIRLEGRLPFVSVTLGNGLKTIVLDNVLLDSGSAATMFSVDEMAKLGILPEPTDPIRRVVGVGGSEFVVAKRIERLALGDVEMKDFPIQIGAMDYGFPINGLLGTDFFVQAKLLLDFDALRVRTSS